MFEGDENWTKLPSPTGELFDWDPDSTYVREVPFFRSIDQPPADPTDVEGARVLALVGDSVTTDHISPAGSIAKNSPGGQVSRGERRRDKGLQQLRLAPREPRGHGPRNLRQHPAAQQARRPRGGLDHPIPSGEESPIYDASVKYAEEARR